MIRELHHVIPKVSRTTIHEAVTEKLGYRKFCTCWVPKTLTDDLKTKWIGSVLKFLTHYAIQARPRRQQLPLISSPKETFYWEKV
jgi:hypothetical protein